jgi:hypothetical protein
MRSLGRGLGRLWAVGGVLLVSAAAATPATLMTSATPLIPSTGEVYAVIVGYNGGQPGLPSLRYADDDAIRFSLFLKGLDAPARRVHVWTLTELDADTRAMLKGAGLAVTADGPPTRTALATVMDDVGRSLAAARRDAPPPAFYFIYAGHGLPGRVLLQPESAGAPAAITGHEISAAISALTRATPDLRVFVFLDACRSQSLFSSRGPDPEIGPDLVPQARSLERAAHAVRIGILTAAFSGRAAGEVRGLAAGSFSHFLASGLRGAADANGDQIVTFGELVAFVSLNTASLTGQRPWFMPPAGDFSQPAIDLRGYRTRLDLSAAPSGQYRVQGINGRPVFAEAFKGPGQRLSLVLPPGRYRLARISKWGQEEGRGVIELHEGQVTDGAAVDLGISGEGISAVRGGDPSEEPGPDDDPPPPSGNSDVDLGEPSLSNAFGPAVVDALVAAYQAGREPVDSPDEGRNSVAVAASLSTAPLGVGGAQPGVSIGYRRRFGALFAGVGFDASRSFHIASEGYRLDRYATLLEGGPLWTRGNRFEAHLAVTAGAVSIVRRADAGPTRGDLAAPAVGAAAGLGLHLSGALSLALSGRYLVEWVRLDGVRRPNGNPTVAMGIDYAF